MKHTANKNCRDRDDSEEIDLRKRRDQADADHDPGNCARCANGRVIRLVNMREQSPEISGEQRNEIDAQKSVPAQPRLMLERGTEKEQRHHIESQMSNAAVQKARGQQAMNLPVHDRTDLKGQRIEDGRLTQSNQRDTTILMASRT